MRIAVSAKDFSTVSGHAGRARRFLIYAVQPMADQAAEPVEIGRIDLPHELTCRGTGAAIADPMDGVSVLLSASFRPPFAAFMSQQGIATVVTDKADPAEAVRDYLARRHAPA
jgi:predicted Fe-Mo cluster-binding NifX family protein